MRQRVASPPQLFGAVAAMLMLLWRSRLRRKKGIPLVDSLDQALAYQPEYIIWVVDPETITEEDLIEVRQTVREAEQVVALGLITGNTLEDAQTLWQRRLALGDGLMYCVHGADPESHVEEGIIIAEDGATTALNSTSLTLALSSTSYLSYVGHGGTQLLGLGCQHLCWL